MAWYLREGGGAALGRGQGGGAACPSQTWRRRRARLLEGDGRRRGVGRRLGLAQSARGPFFIYIPLGRKRKKILNGLQNFRKKFSQASKIKPHKVNIYLGPKCNFEKTHIFPKFK